MGDEFPCRLCDPLPPVTAVLYYRWLAAGLHDNIGGRGSQSLRGNLSPKNHEIMCTYFLPLNMFLTIAICTTENSSNLSLCPTCHIHELLSFNFEVLGHPMLGNSHHEIN